MIKLFNHIYTIKSNNMRLLKLLFICLLILPIKGNAQKRKNKSSKPTIKLTDSLFHGLKWRNIGPFRGGRSVTSTGVIGQPHTYYMGATGGGVFKTTDDGKTALINFLKQALSVRLQSLKVIQILSLLVWESMLHVEL
jgi:hypothetical protein